MDRMYLGKLIIALFLSFKFLIIPFCLSVLVLIKVFSIKSTLKKAGDKYYNEETKRMPVVLVYINIILVVLFVFMVLLGNWIVPILCSFPVIYFLGEFIINKIYGNVFGIYKNGIIDYDKNLKEWKEIHSYTILDNGISGYFSNGNLFECKNIENIDELEKLFKKNNIKKRDKK
jgi:hypothetical protein